MNPKAMAVAFTALMLASTMPAGEARHIDPLVPDVPILPRVYATQDCIPVGVDATILARVNQALAGDPAFYQDDLGVPSLCVNGPVAEYQQFVNDANALLEHVRSVSREIQRQVNWRLEGTLPESSYPNDLVEPRTVLLNDSFDGYRTGGFGDWNVISQRGEDALWSIETIADPNGTVHAYRFGGDAGYERGAHQWLVSPEIDLTALKGNRTAVRDLAYLRETAREHLRYMCNTYRGGNAPQSYGSGDYVFLCGESGSISENSPTQGAPIDVTLPRLHAVVEAYEMAFDDAIYTLPVMQHGAHLDLTYRLNMAPGEDGVRMWIYTGDRAPDRRALFNDTLLRFEASRNCAYHQQTAANVIPQQYDDIGGILSTNQPTYELTCPPTQQGGDIVRDQEAYDNFPTNRERRGGLLVPLEPGKDEGMSATRAFASTPGGGDVFNRVAFTGDVAEWLTARVNLTDWMGDRVWILFEVKTLPNERGDDIFSDTSRFPRQKDFGFQLAHVRVEGDGYHRNFRLKDTAATYVYQIPGNDFNDDTRTRTTTPPGNAPILTWVHNAGDYTENGTVTISVRAKSNATSASFETLGTVRRNVTLEPDQVLTLAVPWGEVLTANHQTLREGWLYEVSASLTERINGTGTLPQQVENLSRTPPILDPNATRVMPANAASIPQLNAGNLSLVQNVRAATIRDVTLLRADRTSGNPLQLCRAPLPLDLRCDEHYAGPKGEPRSVLVGVRNDGNTPQNITLDLSAYLDGVGKPDIIMDDAQKIARDVLPGEVRAVTWTVIASQPGAYDLVITPVPEVPAGVAPPPVKPAERKLYVQRSTGLLCLDSIVERECGPTFNGDLEAALRGQNITAATITPLGALYVATEVREAESEVHSGLLAVRDPVGTWQVLANLSGTVLNETFQAPRDGFGWGAIRSISVAPNGTVFLVGDNDTALRYTPGATGTGLSRIAVNGTMETRLNASAWYKDTLLVVGANGFIGTLVNDTLEPFNVTNTSYEKNDLGQNVTVQRRYAGNFTSLVVAPTGQAVVAGERGVILRHDAARPVTTGWSEARAAGTPSRIVSDALGNRTIHTLGVHGDRVVAGGLELLWASAANGTNGWTAMAMPVPVPETTPRNFTSLAGGRDGRLYALYGNNVAACSSCYGATADWANFLPVRPTVTTSGPLHAAQPAILLAGNATTLLLGEAGMVLELVVSGLPTSLLDWSVVDPLAPRDGGVLQTRRPASNTAYHDMAGRTAANQARTVLLVPDDGGRDAAQRATKFRLFLNHSLNWSGPNKGLEIRLVYRPYPAIVQEAGGATINTCAPDAVPAVRGVSTGAVCKQELLRYVVGNFSNPARFGAGWRHDVWSDLPV
ncbi:MAG TPA: hypothetical protein VFH78_06200, partial [Candidatus Thermoplasmatota archaeon]|nr:hypothetical protein [Candidatus Thermoplasmatota archaeon]